MERRELIKPCGTLEKEAIVISLVSFIGIDDKDRFQRIARFGEGISFC